ncbi:hypothetical protein [Carnimonas bestiolae]|uniref:hypothetical protein n=1 Tax=Carnimonas bestiolae TaxID=3402172 RepID=UPI003EDBA103
MALLSGAGKPSTKVREGAFLGLSAGERVRHRGGWQSTLSMPAAAARVAAGRDQEAVLGTTPANNATKWSGLLLIKQQNAGLG